MKTQNGFTLVELLVVLAMVAFVFGVTTGTNNISFGINGITEERCIAGYKHLIGEGGHVRQVFDQNGHGIPCR